MLDVLGRGDVGDPSRLHLEGMTARALLEEARDRIAAHLGVRPRSIVFTSGATEAVAMVSTGARVRGVHTSLAAVEHSAVRGWAERGPHAVVRVDQVGRVDPDELAASVTPGTGLVHVQWANHEVGTTQPVAEVITAVRSVDGTGSDALIHCDATQAWGNVSLLPVNLGVDLMTLSGHRVGGPVGIGILVIRRGLRLDPLLIGGDQERARRAGMENVAAAVGLAAALDEAVSSVDAEAERRRSLTGRIIEWAESTIGVSVLGDPVDRLPHIVCLGLAGVEPQPVLLGLDSAGISVHSGSSCSSEALEPSPVLEAMGVDADRSLRISVGWNNTDADIDCLLDVLPPILGELRALRGD